MNTRDTHMQPTSTARSGALPTPIQPLPGLPARLLKNAIDTARCGEPAGVTHLCDWFNRHRDPSLALAGSVHLWVRDTVDPTRIRIAFDADITGEDDFAVLTQAAWWPAVAHWGRHVYAVFISRQSSIHADAHRLVTLTLVNGTLYERYGVVSWDDRAIAMEELAAFPVHFPGQWESIVRSAAQER